MKIEKILEVVLRETCAYGDGWRNDWNGFDGRTLQGQLQGVSEWAASALAGKTDAEYTEGTNFCRHKIDGTW